MQFFLYDCYDHQATSSKRKTNHTSDTTRLEDYCLVHKHPTTKRTVLTSGITGAATTNKRLWAGACIGLLSAVAASITMHS